MKNGSFLYVCQAGLIFTQFFADMPYNYKEGESFENEDESFVAKAGNFINPKKSIDTL